MVTKINYDVPRREQILAGQDMLKAIDRALLRELAANTHTDSFAKGQVIFEKGDPSASMMVVIRGKVKICAFSAEGRELVLRFIEQNGIFGEIGMLDGASRSANAVALEPTDLLVLDRSRFVPFLQRNPEVAMKIIALLTKRLRSTSEHLEDTMFLQAEPRLARSLLRLAETFGKSVANGSRLEIKLSQSVLGNFIGASRESVNKYLGEWSDARLIRVDSGLITILNRDGLEDIAMPDHEAPGEDDGG